MTPANMFAALSIAVMFVIFLPGRSQAVNNQANTQCPPGGQVGQACKDTTNGYTTSGHCTFIGICKADQFPPAPKAPPEEHTSPLGPTVSTTSAYGRPINTSSSTDRVPVFVPDDDGAGAWSPEEIIAAAYQRAQSIPSTDGSGEAIESYIKFLYFEGSTYLVTPSEILKVGSELQAAPSGASGIAGIVPEEFNTEGFKTFAGIYPDLDSISDQTGVEKRVFSEPFGRSTFGAPRSDSGDGGSLLAALVNKVKTRAMNLSDMEKKSVSVVLGGVFIVLLYLLYDRYSRRGSRGVPENAPDYSKLSHRISDKDESVASPIPDAPQGPVIWDKPEKKE